MTDDQTELITYLTPRSVEAMDTAARLTGHSRTNTVNRALQLYAAVVRAAEAGGGESTVDLFVWRDCKITVKPRN